MTNKLPDGFEFIDLDDITQGHLEKWQRHYLGENPQGTAVNNGALVRATIKAGWFKECPWKADDVAKQPMKGNLVPLVARCIDDFYGEVKALAEPDPN